ncbi:MAG TPA: TraR/DksA C4-type zinc finger protein [Planctomycetaceae bacterium]|nr:TraR/DksA C4-type zinc finger protein [Planctomycetaceae bacterium]
MNATAEHRFRNLLMELQSRLEPEIAGIVESVRSPSGGQHAGELSNAPLHLGDRGTDEFLQDMAATVLANEEHLATEVRDALRRLDEGRYGRCGRCDVEIVEARLAAIPYARYCVSCAMAIEEQPAANVNRGRPQTPDDVLSPTGDMGERRRDRARQDARDADAQQGEDDSTNPADADRHAAGTAGGGTSVGGLAGTTIGHGDPDVATIEDITGSGDLDAREIRNSTRPRKKF